MHIIPISWNHFSADFPFFSRSCICVYIDRYLYREEAFFSARRTSFLLVQTIFPLTFHFSLVFAYVYISIDIFIENRHFSLTGAHYSYQLKSFFRWLSIFFSFFGMYMCISIDVFIEKRLFWLKRLILLGRIIFLTDQIVIHCWNQLEKLGRLV